MCYNIVITMCFPYFRSEIFYSKYFVFEYFVHELGCLDDIQPTYVDSHYSLPVESRRFKGLISTKNHLLQVFYPSPCECTDFCCVFRPRTSLIQLATKLGSALNNPLFRLFALSAFQKILSLLFRVLPLSIFDTLATSLVCSPFLRR